MKTTLSGALGLQTYTYTAHVQYTTYVHVHVHAGCGLRGTSTTISYFLEVTELLFVQWSLWWLECFSCTCYPVAGSWHSAQWKVAKCNKVSQSTDVQEATTYYYYDRYGTCTCSMGRFWINENVAVRQKSGEREGKKRERLRLIDLILC